MVKTFLKLYRKSNGHRADDGNIPQKTCEEAGLTLTKTLGHGAFGTVKLAEDDNGEEKCVKVFKKTDMNGSGVDELKEEFEIMHETHNQHLAKTFDFFQDSTTYYIVNEPYYGGDLTGIIKKCNDQEIELTEEYWKGIFYQAFQGLSFLHDKALMHCDLKEDNMMLRTTDLSKPKIVIIDFGLAQHAADHKQQVCGTPGYIPPEVFKSQMWFPKGDVFSVGVMMLQLVIGEVPEIYEPENGPAQQLKFGIFQGGTTPQEMQQKVTTMVAPVDRIPYEMDGLREFIPKCLEKKRADRINAKQALADPIFAKMGGCGCTLM